MHGSVCRFYVTPSILTVQGDIGVDPLDTFRQIGDPKPGDSQDEPVKNNTNLIQSCSDKDLKGLCN